MISGNSLSESVDSLKSSCSVQSLNRSQIWKKQSSHKHLHCYFDSGETLLWCRCHFSVFVLQAAWLLKAVTCIDLTTLSGDDTPSNVHRLCLKAIQPLQYDLLRKMDMHDKGADDRQREKHILFFS